MIHILPLNDLIEHTADCECCNPFLDDGGVWIHHSADKREQYERQGKTGGGWTICYEDEVTGLLIPLPTETEDD